jgi:hypothetical protein
LTQLVVFLGKVYVVLFIASAGTTSCGTEEGVLQGAG